MRINMVIVSPNIGLAQKAAEHMRRVLRDQMGTVSFEMKIEMRTPDNKIGRADATAEYRS